MTAYSYAEFGGLLVLGGLFMTTRPSNPPYNAVLLAHAGEIGVKSQRTRSRMIVVLQKNVEMQFADLHPTTKNIQNRTLVWSDADPRSFAQELAQVVMGISGASPVFFFEDNGDYDHLVRLVTDYCLEVVQDGCSFGFRSKTSGKGRLPSQPLSAALGAALLDAMVGRDVRVNLTDPDYWFTVEVRHGSVWVWHEQFPSFGGLPLRTQPGFVVGVVRPWLVDYKAFFHMVRRGVVVKPLRFDTGLSPDPRHDLLLSRLTTKTTHKVRLAEVLEGWVGLFGENLCTACSLLTELYASLFVSGTKGHGVVSGLALSLTGGDTPPEVLHWLEQQVPTSVFRPTLFPLEGLVTPFGDDLPHPTCCPFRPQRFLNHPLTAEEVEVVRQTADRLAGQPHAPPTEE